MNTIVSTLFVVLAAWFVISRFLPVKGVQNINGKELKSIVGKQGKYTLSMFVQ
ncbi:hypothetical protein BTGOE5_00730 [Bacillus thuringiensis]|nr:hypothetical protein BTGOE5_00730 [Bacillus thuringiensis]OFD10440.1 hypothetical protein BTGOE7_01050 [Bacillus thuringiensis]